MNKRNTKAAPAASEVKALTVPERAVAALGYNVETVNELTLLAAGSASITEITNDAGYQQCHASRMVLKNTRLEIAKRGKTAREDAQKFSKAVIAEEDRLIGIIQPEETRLQALQDAHDEAIEAEKLRLAQIEVDRVTKLQARVEAIRRMSDLPVNPTPQYVLDRILEAEVVEVGESFEEYEQQASDAKGATILHLREEHRAAEQRVAAEKKRAEDLAELEQLRREKAARDTADRKKREDDERAERDRQAEERGRQMATSASVRENAVAQQPIVAQQLGTPEPEVVHERNRQAVAESMTRQAAPTLEDFQRKANITPTIVENLGAGLLTHVGDERPSFDEIVRTVAWHFETDEATARTWIVDAGSIARAA